MISKKEHENARVRVLRRLALIASGGCFMAMGFYAIMARVSLSLTPKTKC